MTDVGDQSVSGFSANWKKLKESIVISANQGHQGKKNRYRGSPNKESQTIEPAAKRWKRKNGSTENGSVGGPSVHDETRLTKLLAMDCEFVGVGEDGVDNMLARVSLVNAFGNCVYDKFVKPTEPVTDYRTAVSGIREKDLSSGEVFAIVQREVCDMIEGRRLVGHAIHNDLKVLHLSHPKKHIRDTSKYKPFKAIARSKHPSLKNLCRLVLGIRIQDGEHDSVCDAKSALQLYLLHKDQWEARLRNPSAPKWRSSVEENSILGQRPTVDRKRLLPRNRRQGAYRDGKEVPEKRTREKRVDLSDRKRDRRCT